MPADGQAAVTPFGDYLNQVTAAETQTLTLSPDWGQGRAIYGGLVGALLLRAMQSAVGTERPLRSMMVSFVGPLAPETCELTTRILRSGSSVTQAEARIGNGDQTAAVALGSFGAARASDIRIAAATRPDAPAPDTVKPFPYIEGAMPRFLQHVDMRWTSGNPPMVGASDPDFAGWCRFRETAQPFDDAWLVGLLDAWPPSVLPMFTAFHPCSSLTWAIDMVNPAAGADPGDYWYYNVSTQGAADGFVQADARLWLPDGRLAAVSRQTVVVFDKRE